MVTSILQDQQHVWYKMFAHGRETAADKEDLVTVLLRRPMQRSRRSIPSCGQTVCDGINVYMNLDDMLKNETLMFDV